MPDNLCQIVCCSIFWPWSDTMVPAHCICKADAEARRDWLGRSVNVKCTEAEKWKEIQVDQWDLSPGCDPSAALPAGGRIRYGLSGCHVDVCGLLVGWKVKMHKTDLGKVQIEPNRNKTSISYNWLYFLSQHWVDFCHSRGNVQIEIHHQWDITIE